MEGMVGLMMVMWLAVAVVVVLWICMPFAIFGTKPLLRVLIAEQKKTNELLAAAAARSQASN
jgi:F0F1-type ATP synthase membrane subunit b/b'